MNVIRSARRISLGIILFSALCSSNACSPTDAGKKVQARARGMVPAPRIVFALIDKTGSFHFHGQSMQKILDMIDNLGPGDRFYLIDIGPEFRPETNLRIQLHMPDVPADILKPETPEEWERNQDKLEAVWQDVALHQHSISAFLHHSGPESSGQTDVFGALEYCSERLGREGPGERYVFIFSDLIHDLRDVTTANPPSFPLSFSGAQINVLFMPRRDRLEWDAKETAWRTWSLQKAGAVSFAMFDPAESEIAPLLKSSSVLRSLPSSFNEE